MTFRHLLPTTAVLAIGLTAAGCVPVSYSGQSDASLSGQFSPVFVDRSGSGRDRPRIPGGSGCDDPGDVLEHPECRR